MFIQNTLSARLKVKPLKEGEVKIFKLVGNGKIDHATGQARYNSGGHFTGIFTIYDKFETEASKKKKILRNVTGTAVVEKDGKETLEEVVSDIEFNNRGIRVVKHDEYATLVCLTRANENASNPFRDKSKPAIWEEMSPAETKKELLDNMAVAFKAESYARTADIRDLQALAKKLSATGVKELMVSSDKKADELRHDLIFISRKYPKELLRNSKDKEMKLKIIIDDAIKLFLLDFDEDKKEWIWCVDSSTIVAVPAGTEPVAELVDHLTKNKESNQRLISSVNEIMKSEVEA
jgi:hypothetical protein